MYNEDPTSEGRPADFERVGLAIEFLERNWRRRPSLREVAGSVHLSEFHFQRLFTRWAGITPKQFIQTLTLAAARQTLADGASVLDASLNVGLSGPGRLHDLFVTIDAVTPGEFKRHGQGLTIEYGLHESPFGRCLIGATPRGICWLTFSPRRDPDAALSELRASWPDAQLHRNNAGTAPVVDRIFATADGTPSRPLRLLVRGTNFQVKVWQALLRIPSGRFVSYADIAGAIGSPRAVRAVGQAVGANNIAFVIPCHRVLRSGGDIGGYGGGLIRKRAMLAWEVAHLYETPQASAPGAATTGAIARA